MTGSILGRAFYKSLIQACTAIATETVPCLKYTSADSTLNSHIVYHDQFKLFFANYTKHKRWSIWADSKKTTKTLLVTMMF